MSSPDGGELLRAAIFHTSANPFVNDGTLECHWDGGLLIRRGRIAACGEYAAVRAAHPDVETTDWRGGFLLPGLVDTHIHFPQIRVIGNLGRSLLDWLEQCALPEEARMADEGYTRTVACEFVRAPARHGTTTAVAFGAHFAPAVAALFEAAEDGTCVAHCPCSNSALGSGVLPFRRHLRAGVRCALGSDVGGATGFGLMKEALQAYLMQRIAPEHLTHEPAQLLYLATRAGAEAVRLEQEIGDFQFGKAADFVYLRPPAESPLSAAVAHADNPERALAALFTMAGPESVAEVPVEGTAVYAAGA